MPLPRRKARRGKRLFSNFQWGTCHHFSVSPQTPALQKTLLFGAEEGGPAGQSPAFTAAASTVRKLLLVCIVVASFSNFLATFDQDLWQALILREEAIRTFPANDRHVRQTTICRLIVMHVFQPSFNSSAAAAIASRRVG